MVKIRQSAEAAGERGRWSARRKREVVLRVLRGGDLDALGRELGVTAGAIARWRDQFVAGARRRSRVGRPTSGTTRSPGCERRSAS
jgi:transposase-like protein